MKIGDIVNIVCSPALIDLKLTALCGQRCVIVEKRKHGCWVELECNSYMGEKEWFIPYDSLQSIITK